MTDAVATPEPVQLCGQAKRGDPDSLCDRDAGHDGRHHYALPKVAARRPAITIHAGLSVPVLVKLLNAIDTALDNTSIDHDRNGNMVVSAVIDQ